MSDPASVIARIPVRSMGLKLLLVCALALAMSIPALFVFALLMDRTHRANDVTSEISQAVGGAETFLGPVIAVPYEVPQQGQAPVQGVYVVFPARADAEVTTAVKVRRRSLFHVPVYQARLRLGSDFDLTASPSNAPAGAVLDWSRARFLVGVADPRGAQADAVLETGGKSLTLAPVLAPAQLQPTRDKGGSGDQLSFFGADGAGLVKPGARLDAEARLSFTGAKRLAVLAYGDSTTLAAKGDWASPSFDGGFLPARSTLSKDGFSASWTVPFIARGVPAEGTSDVLTQLAPAQLGVSFVDPANPYQSVARALKYAVLFIGLVFLAYFLFETATGHRVHPAQYVLIGLAQMIFYLLLLSVAEQVGFDLAFLASAAATVALISAYAGWVFESRRRGAVAFLAFGLLYGLIYVLMRLEDLALLVGAVASFAAIAAVMYLTRRLDWYGATSDKTTEAN